MSFANPNIREKLTQKLGAPIDRSMVNLCDRIICQHKYGLDITQQIFIEERKSCKESGILKLAREALKIPELIEQSQEFKNVRKFLQKIWRGGEYHNFTDDELDFIFQNYERLTPKEISTHLLPTKDSPWITRAIAYLIDVIGHKPVSDEEQNNLVVGRYVPPQSDEQIIDLINRSDFAANFKIKNLDAKKRDSIAAIKKFLAAPRFVEMASMFVNQRHRDVFETEFVKAVYDKPDLISDEVNLYIALASEYVTMLEIRQQMSILNHRLAESMSDDEEGRKFTMSLSEALKDKTSAYNLCSKRILDMTKSLSGDRIKKLDKQAAVNQSLTKFVELVKEEKERKRLMVLARAQEFKVKERIEELENYSDLFVEVFGLGREEPFNL